MRETVSGFPESPGQHSEEDCFSEEDGKNFVI